MAFKAPTTDDPRDPTAQTEPEWDVDNVRKPWLACSLRRHLGSSRRESWTCVESEGVQSVKVPQSAVDLGFKTLNAVHRAVLWLSGGRIGGSAGGMPVVQLHTIGRKSGRSYSTMLTSPICEPERVIVVASKGGDDRDPDWYLNVVAHPDVEVTLEGQRIPMRARTASTGEKDELWPQVVKTYKGYAGYEKRSLRNIPLVICEPR
jgi:deazaflavin-dependent oxidoreductase (nitroreductase family)